MVAAVTRPCVAKLRFACLLALLVAPGAFACATAELKQPAASEPTPNDPLAPVDPTGPGSAPDAGGGSGTRGAASDAGQGASPATSSVTIQVQPTDSGDALLKAIRGAKKSIHMTMYLLSNDQVIGALGDLATAGKDVKVVLNKTFPPNGGSNDGTFQRLQQRGVSVVWAPPGYSFTHAKTIVIDGEKAVIMTMNLTETSARTNREFIAIDTDPADVADVESLFEADYANTSVKVTGKLVVSPPASTNTDARSRLTSLIESATTSVDVEVQSLSDEGIVGAIVAAQQRNLKVRVVVSGETDTTTAQSAALAKLRAAGVPVAAATTPDIHAKAIVVDGARAFVGSQNFTSTALFSNREVGVVIDAAVEVAKVQAAIAKDFASVPR